MSDSTVRALTWLLAWQIPPVFLLGYFIGARVGEARELRRRR